MANEIKATIQLTVAKGTLALTRSSQRSIDMSGTNYTAGAQSIGTGAHEALTLVDVSTAGYGFFVNTDTTNYVEIGRDSAGTFVPLVKLKPGEAALFRLASTAPYAKANTAAVVLDWIIFAD